MRRQGPEKATLTRVRRSRRLKQVSATVVTAAILIAGAGAVTPAHAATSPQELNQIYEKVKAALEASQQPSTSPLEGLKPAPGGPLEQSISDLESDLNAFLPDGSLPPTDPNAPNLINQNPKSTGNNQLNITVAKSMLVTTSPSGTPNLNVLLSNTQVSGNGAATVKVPVATDAAKNSSGFTAPQMDGQNIVYNVDNAVGTVQTFAASNGSYKGKLPITVDVQAWLDGQRIDPADMVNVTGKVKLIYSFHNVTSEMTRISFKGPDGSLITQDKNIPIPFGGAFSITLPPQFANVNAPWAEGGVSPSGTTLSGTIMMIPPLGSVDQSVTIDARADGASLPGASFQALPITLSDQASGRLVYKALPLGSDIANVAVQAGAFGQSDIAKLRALVNKYSAVATGISNKYVEPIAQAFKDGQVDDIVREGESQLVQLDQGAAQLARLLPTATTVIKYVSEGLTLAVQAFENNTGTINTVIKYINLASTTLNSYLPQIKSAVDWLETNLYPLATKGKKLTKAAESICSQVQSYMTAYPWSTIEPILTQIKTLVETYLPAYSPEVDALYNALEGLYDNEDYVADCVTYAQELNTLLTDLQNQMPAIINGLQEFENGVTSIAGYLSEADQYATDFQALEPAIIKALDNNNCPKTPDGINKCGYMQQMAFLTQLMNLASTTVTNSMVPGLDSVVKYLPAANKFVGLADKYVPILAGELEQMVAAGFQGAENALNSGDAMLAKFTSKADKAAVLVASYTAQLEIMNARAQSGQGIPAGPAQGANTNLGAYQYQIAGADSQDTPTLIMFGLAGILILLSAAVGTVLYSKNKV